MPNYNNPEDNSLLRMISELQDRIERLERNSSGENVTGGSVNYSGTELVIQDTAGNLVFKVGVMPEGDYGLEFRHADTDTKSMTIMKPFSPTDPQVLNIYDRSGHYILSESYLFGSGLDVPYFAMPMRPIDRSDAKTTTSATFTSLFVCNTTRNNPAARFVFHVLCSDGTTSGEIQVINQATGNPLAKFFQPAWVGTIPTGTTTETLITSEPLVLPGTYIGDTIAMEVQVRRTAGAGTVSVGIARSIGGPPY